MTPTVVSGVSCRTEWTPNYDESTLAYPRIPVREVQMHEDATPCSRRRRQPCRLLGIASAKSTTRSRLRSLSRVGGPFALR